MPPSPELSYDSKVESYDAESGDLYMRTFGIADNLLTSNNWLARAVAQFGKSFIGKWIIDHEKAKGVHAKFTNLAKWLDASKKAAIATITGVDMNEKTGALDVIYKVTDPETKAEVLDALKNNTPIKWRFSSPAIWGTKLRRDPTTGTIIYDEWQGVHIALLKKNPAFPSGIAQINDNVCVGGIQCANELAAIAVKIEEPEPAAFIPHDGKRDLIISHLGDQITSKHLGENFTFDKNRMPNNADKLSMSGEEGNKPKTVPYEEYIKKSQEIDQIKSKYEESLKVIEKESTDKKTILAAKDELQSKWDQRESEDRKKFFTEKFSKILKTDEEINEKVSLFLEKKYNEDDFNKLYGNMLKDAEEQEKAAEKQTKTPKAGIASSSQMDNTIKENVGLAVNLLNQRKRVF